MSKGPRPLPGLLLSLSLARARCIQVDGRSNSTYLCLPDSSYCDCDAFEYSTGLSSPCLVHLGSHSHPVLKHEAVMVGSVCDPQSSAHPTAQCKHLLATKLAVGLGVCGSSSVSDEDFVKIMCSTELARRS